MLIFCIGALRFLIAQIFAASNCLSQLWHSLLLSSLRPIPAATSSPIPIPLHPTPAPAPTSIKNSVVAICNTIVTDDDDDDDD